MELTSLAEQSNESLFLKVKDLQGSEREITAELIRYLHEIEGRKSYLQAGYSSLFMYCHHELGYSEGAAFRRSEAAKALSNCPEIYEQLKSGAVTLCAISLVSKVLTPENKLEVFAQVSGKTKLQVQEVAARLGAVKPTRKKSIVVHKVLVPETPILEAMIFDSKQPGTVPSPTKHEVTYSVSVELTQEEMKLYQEAKELVGPCSAKDVILRTLREFVSRRKKKAKPIKIVKRTSTGEVKAPKVRSRFIPIEVKREVRDQCGGQCTFVGINGNRCPARQGLQFDHVRPFALGGGNDAGNLRLMCPAHNRLLAEQVFPGRVPSRTAARR